MENIFFISAVVLVILFAGALLWVLFAGRKSAKNSPNDDDDDSSVSVVRVRSAASGKTVMEIYSDDDIVIDGPVPFYPDLEQEEMDEETLIERWRRTDLTRAERSALAREMREVGYQVEYDDEEPEDGGASSEARAPEAESKSVPTSLPDDVDALMEIISSSQYTDDYKNEAKRKLKAVLSSAPSPSEGSEDGGSGKDDGNDGGEESDLSGDGFENGGGFEIDPVTGAPVSRDEPSDEPPVEEEEEESAEEPTPAEKDAPDNLEMIDEDYSVVYSPQKESPLEESDDRDSRLAMELMRFIKRSFSNGLIEPELVSFAEKRLNLKIVYEWTEEQKARALSRSREFVDLEDKSVDELDAFVRSVVEQNRARKSESTPSHKITIGFDKDGGKNDIMWQRLHDMARTVSAQQD